MATVVPMAEILRVLESQGLIDLLETVTGINYTPAMVVNWGNLAVTIQSMVTNICVFFSLDPEHTLEYFGFLFSAEKFIAKLNGSTSNTKRSRHVGNIRRVLHTLFLAPFIKKLQGGFCYLCHRSLLTYDLVYLDETSRAAAATTAETEGKTEGIYKSNIFPKPSDCGLLFSTRKYCYGDQTSFGIINWESGCQPCNNKMGTSNLPPFGSYAQLLRY